MRVAVLVLTSLLLAGCYPVPTQNASAWSGTVYADEAPVPGAAVTLTRRDGARAVARTDSLGRFDIAGERGWAIKWLIRFSSIDCNEQWSVVVEREGGASRGVAHSGMGPCTPPDLIRVACDFARDGVFCEVLEPARLNRELEELAPRPLPTPRSSDVGNL